MDFFDRDGKVVIPVPSNPLQIEVSTDTAIDRPADNVAITQIVDSRELSENLLTINVSASADGLLPNLDRLLDLTDYALPVLDVEDEGGLQVKRLHNGAEGLFPKSERSWIVHLDPTPILRGVSERVDFEFPVALSPGTDTVYRRFEEMDPVDAAAKITLVEGEAVATVAQVDYRLWFAGAVGVFLLLAGLMVILARNQKSSSSEAPSLFSLPTEFTPFSVIALLHRIKSSQSVELTDEQRLSLQSDMQTLERQTFAREEDTSRTRDLEALARRWLGTAIHLQIQPRSGDSI